MNRTNMAARMGVLILALAMGACSATRTQQSAGEVVDDSTLTAKVKTALISDPVTKANQINVETYRGVVQLGGFVDCPVHDRYALAPGARLRGPALIEEREATILIGADDRVEIDAHGNIVAEIEPKQVEMAA